MVRRWRKLRRRSILGIRPQRRSQIDRKTLDRQALDGEAEHGETLDGETFDQHTREILDGRHHPRIDGAQARGKAVHAQAFNERSEILRCGQASAESAGAASHDRTQAAVRRCKAERRRFRLSGAILELKARQSRVEPAARVERAVGSFFDDPAVIHDHDAVGRAHGREPVRDDDCRAMLHQPVKRVLDKPLAFRVQR